MITLTRQQLRERIDALECIHDLQQVVEDVRSVEWEKDEAQALNLHVCTRENNSAISFLNNLPPAVVEAGLRAMELELMKLADVREVAHG